MKQISTYLEQMQKKLPTWFKMRKSNQTDGAAFLNVMGWTLQDVKDLLDYAYNNQFLPTADTEQVDIVYKTSIPSVLTPSVKRAVRIEGGECEEATSLYNFTHGLRTDALYNQEIFYDNIYYIDYEKALLYVKKPYDADDNFPEGKITLILSNENNVSFYEQELKLSLHHIWNFFDEFGLLLGVPRLYGEKNADFKIRLLDVFRYPHGSHLRGLRNAISRELGLKRNLVWKDGGQDYVLKDSRINKESIYVDGEQVPVDQLDTDEKGRIVLYGDYMYETIERKIQYIYGVSLNELADKQDTAFQEELFDVEGHPRPLLNYYIERINDRVPVLWDSFVWGVGFWDAANLDTSGEGAVSTFFDASIEGWRKYK